MSNWERRSDFRKIFLLNLVATPLTVVLGPMATEISVILNVNIFIIFRYNVKPCTTNIQFHIIYLNN